MLLQLYSTPLKKQISGCFYIIETWKFLYSHTPAATKYTILKKNL